MINAMSQYMRRPSLKAALIAFGLSRTIILLAFLMAVLAPLFNVIDLSEGISQAWYRWDTVHYVDIAVGDGYWYKPNTNSTVAFFPVYPMLMRTLAIITHDAVLAGLLISQVTFFLALILLYQITCQIISYQDANRTLIYISLFPTALFYFAAYSESIFLLFSVLTWYAAREGAKKRNWRWWLVAGLSGMLASGTRAIGLIIIIFPLSEWLNSNNFSLNNLRTTTFWQTLWNDRIPPLTMLLIPLGLLGFMAFLGLEFNGPLLFLRIQEEGWGFKTLGPIAIISRDLGKLIQGISISPNALALYGWLDLIVFFLTLSLSFTIFKYVGWAGTVYSLISILVPISSRLESMARYSVVLFPVFMALAVWGRNSKLDFILRIICIFTLVLTTFLFLKHFFVG